MNILPSIVESYNYAEMYNHNAQQDGGAEKVLAGGMPVQYALEGVYSPYIGGDATKRCGEVIRGKLSDKVVPVGLALINIQPRREVEYASEERENETSPQYDVLSDLVFDHLFTAVSKKSVGGGKKRITLKKRFL